MSAAPMPPFCPAGFCLVGLCHGKTGGRLRARPGGLLCELHTGKLSAPMADRLRWALHDAGLEAIDGGLVAELVAEARKHDERWPEFAVIADGRAPEPFEGWRAAMRRAAALGSDTRIASTVTWECRELARVYVAHVGGDQGVVGYGESLGEALGHAERNATNQAGKVDFRHGAPTMYNTLTGQGLSLEAARAMLAAR